MTAVLLNNFTVVLFLLVIFCTGHVIYGIKFYFICNTVVQLKIHFIVFIVLCIIVLIFMFYNISVCYVVIINVARPF